jgi:hypothetical protein
MEEPLFRRDLFLATEPSGVFHQELSFAYNLARSPV